MITYSNWLGGYAAWVNCDRCPTRLEVAGSTGVNPIADAWKRARKAGWSGLGVLHLCQGCTADVERTRVEIVMEQIQRTPYFAEEVMRRARELMGEGELMELQRKPWDEYFFELARQAATRSTCSRAKIGAVAVTKDHRVLATAYNGAPSGEQHCVDLPEPIVFANHDMHCVHAEANIVDQLRALNRSVVNQIWGNLEIEEPEESIRRWIESQEITVYTYGPRDVCTDCARTMFKAGIKDARVAPREAA